MTDLREEIEHVALATVLEVWGVKLDPAADLPIARAILDIPELRDAIGMEAAKPDRPRSGLDPKGDSPDP